MARPAPVEGENLDGGHRHISEAKAQLSALVEQVRAGEPVLIAKAGKPIAVLAAYEPSAEPRALGGWEGQIWIAQEFDAPLPGELQRHFDVPAA